MTSKKLLITAGIGIIIILAVVYFLNFRDGGTKQMYNKYFEPYPNIITSKDRSEGQGNGRLNKIMNDYEEGQYAKALRKLNGYLEENPNKQKVRFYRGITNLKLGNMDKAIEDFEKVAVGGDDLSVQATWYLGLTYLRKGEQDQAVFYFRGLVKDSTRYAMNAEEILNNLGSAIAIGNERLYEITEEGKYQFTYWQDKDPEPHPITERTFYLETRDLNIIPEDVSYRKFQRLNTEEQRSIIVDGQKDVITAMSEGLDEEKIRKAEDRAESLMAEMREKEESDALGQAESPTLASKGEDVSLEKKKEVATEPERPEPAKKKREDEAKTRNRATPENWMRKSLTNPNQRMAVPDKEKEGKAQDQQNQSAQGGKRASAQKTAQSAQSNKSEAYPSHDDLPWTKQADTVSNPNNQVASSSYNVDDKDDLQEDISRLVKFLTNPSLNQN